MTLILVVEDEDLVRDLVVRVLERRGHTVIAVNSGEAALQVIASRGSDIHLLLTDVVMTGIDGPELLIRARRQRPDLKAIFMSGYTAEALDQRQIPEGVAFLEKPFTLSRLAEAVGEVLG